MLIGLCAQVRELVLPLGHHALRSVWNPASKRQTRAAAALLADLLVYVPADDAKMQVGQVSHSWCPYLSLLRTQLVLQPLQNLFHFKEFDSMPTVYWPA